MSLMNFASRANKPLLEILNSVLADYDFKPEKQKPPARPDHAIWAKQLGPTLRAVISVTLNSTLAPDTWSLAPVVFVYSSYVAIQSHVLGLQRDCCLPDGYWKEQEELQLLRFSPANIRWQDDLDLKYPTLEGRAETLGALKADFRDVYERYVSPILEILHSPLAVAEFQLRAAYEFPSARLSWSEPRYKVSNEFVSTALLFMEAGKPEKGLAVLEEARQQKVALSQARNGTYMKKLFCKIDKLSFYLRMSSAD